jgi:hypothetical protein
MTKLTGEYPSDPDVLAILEALGPYKASHPRSKIDAYRYNSASIRIRIIDPDFQKMDRAIRHDLIWELLEGLTEDTASQVTLLLLLTPSEVKRSLANMDFEDPIPSNL